MGGGLALGDMVLVMGPPGSGKTTVSMQIAFHQAHLAQPALYVSTYSEPPNRLVRHLRPFSFFDESVISKTLFFRSVYPLILEGNLRAIRNALTVDVEKHSATLIVLDGLMTFYDLCTDARELRTFIYELSATLSALECTTVVTTSQSDPVAGHQFPELTLSDAIVQLGIHDVGSQMVRTIRAWKTRGAKSNLGTHSFVISATGVTVFPRFESIDVPTDIIPGQGRAPFGVDAIDTLMSGGPPVGSATMLSGPQGTGKTLLCLQFLAEGALHGQKGLALSLGNTASELMDKASSFNLDLRGLIGAGQVGFVHYATIDLIPDEFAWRLWEAVERESPARLVIDGITELEWALAEHGRGPGYFVGLVRKLRHRGITSVITRETALRVGRDLDFSNYVAAALAENVLVLRDVERRGEILRTLCVLKMANSDCDRSIRQYTITSEGFRLLPKRQVVEGGSRSISKRRASRQASRQDRG